MLGYFSAHIICSEKRTIFRECSSRKSVICEDQRMTKDKYLSITIFDPSEGSLNPLPPKSANWHTMS